MSFLRRAGLVGLAAPFVVMGWSGATEPGGRVALAASLGIPSPEVAVRFNGAAMVAGGLALATGVLPRAAALGLAASLVPTTLAAHSYWRTEDPKMRTINRIQFLKNLGLLGGLVAVAAAPRDPSPGA
ncbi:MAG: DoxX family protein [Kineosporiaceae bacterium]|nr:DoxX family protein [Kineosporiaceae bacterium]